MFTFYYRQRNQAAKLMDNDKVRWITIPMPSDTQPIMLRDVHRSEMPADFPDSWEKIDEDGYEAYAGAFTDAARRISEALNNKRQKDYDKQRIA